MNQEFVLGKLSELMSWDEDRSRTEFAWLRLMSRMKYDSYQDFLVGMRFIESLVDWLQQFAPGEREAGYQFVRQNLVFIGPGEMRHVVELFYPETVPTCRVERFDVFDMDIAPVGGRRATSIVDAALKLDGVTDIVLDCSALSVAVMFPIAKYCYDRARSPQNPVNFHLLVLDDPVMDGRIEASPCGQASPLHAFQGGLGLERARGAARLWLPQLGPGNRRLLSLVHQFLGPDVVVCPILPFPANHPRDPDRLIEEYGDLFETIAGQFKAAWQVDSRDLIYVHDKSPLDLYRTILRIDDARSRVFEQTGGSQIILTPVGSKALSLGMFMAAIERDFAVVSVEAIEYKPDPVIFASRPDFRGELVHIWLHGEAYNDFGNREVAKP